MLRIPDFHAIISSMITTQVRQALQPYLAALEQTARMLGIEQQADTSASKARGKRRGSAAAAAKGGRAPKSLVDLTGGNRTIGVNESASAGAADAFGSRTLGEKVAAANDSQASGEKAEDKVEPMRGVVFLRRGGTQTRL